MEKAQVNRFGFERCCWFALSVLSVSLTERPAGRTQLSGHSSPSHSDRFGQEEKQDVWKRLLPVCL